MVENRNVKIMTNSVIFFIEFPISGLEELNIYQNLVCFTRKWEDCGGLSDCEELVGVTYRRGWGYSV